MNRINQKKVDRWEDSPKAKMNKYSERKNMMIESKDQSDNFNTGWYQENDLAIRILENLYNSNLSKVKENKERFPHKNLYKIVCNKEILRLAHRKLLKNKNVMIPWAEDITAININDKFLEDLSNDLINEKFTWNTAKRIDVEKSGNKKKKRPLGINDFKNKIVQEALRMLLEAIYEPEFRKYETNSGFRPKRDCARVIENIKIKAQFANLVIEGDTISAYDNVNHNILINILKKRIKDKKLITLIYKGFKAGIIQEKTYIDTFLGIPQGGVCSSILFNIYMHEFDKYIIDDLQEIISKEDNNASRSSEGKENPKYKKVRKRIKKLKDEIILENSHDTIEKKDIKTLIVTILDNRHLFNGEIWDNIISRGKEFVNKKRTQKNAKPNALIIQIKKEIESNSNLIQKKTLINYIIDKIGEEIKITTLNYKQLNRTNIKHSKIMMYYHRYADDWTLWLRCPIRYALKLKNKIKEFLKEKLILELSEEKTKITILNKDQAKFLGFSIYITNNKKRKLVKTNNNDELISKKIFTNISVDLDRKRIDTSFIEIGFCEIIKYYDKPNRIKPREIGWLTVFEIQQIIEKFNQFMLGFGNYYITVINEPSRISKYIYILYYSCILTLCCKLKISSKELTNRYGYYDISDKDNIGHVITNKDKPNLFFHTDIRICYKYKYDGKEKWVVLLNYKELMSILLKNRKNFINQFNLKNENYMVPNIDYFSMYKINFRTRYKMTSHCIICGSTQAPLHNHYVRKLEHESTEKMKGYESFDKLVASLNRKQITICKNCHNNIHSGSYNGLKFIDLYDIRLVIPKNYIRMDRKNDFSQDRKPMTERTEKDDVKFLVNEINKTYWNRDYNEYLKKNKNQKFKRKD